MGHRRRFSAYVAKDCNFAPVIRQSLQFAHDFLAAHDFQPRLQVKLAIVVEELVTNALCHGGKGQDFSLSLELAEKDGSIALRMEDNGIAFNPLSVPPAKAPNPITGGGIGLAIVHAWATDTNYERGGVTNSLGLTLA